MNAVCATCGDILDHGRTGQCANCTLEGPPDYQPLYWGPQHEEEEHYENC